MDRQSVTVSLPIERQTETIMATEATLTASRNTENSLESRIFLTSGLSKATNTNEGKKMPMVETTAPFSPLI